MFNAKPKYAGKFSRKDLPSSITYYETQNIILKGNGAWRDAVWSYCYTNASSATSSTTWAQLLPLLPVAPW